MVRLITSNSSRTARGRPRLHHKKRGAASAASKCTVEWTAAMTRATGRTAPGRTFACVPESCQLPNVRRACAGCGNPCAHQQQLPVGGKHAQLDTHSTGLQTSLATLPPPHHLVDRRLSKKHSLWLTVCGSGGRHKHGCHGRAVVGRRLAAIRHLHKAGSRNAQLA